MRLINTVHVVPLSSSILIFDSCVLLVLIEECPCSNISDHLCLDVIHTTHLALQVSGLAEVSQGDGARLLLNHPSLIIIAECRTSEILK